MSWVKLDDGFTEHPKIDALSDGAFRLYVAALCYSARHLTDGIVPVSRLPRLVPRYKPSQRAELLEERPEGQAWHEPGHHCPNERCAQPPAGHIVIHRYLDRNPTAQEEEARKSKRADAGRLGGQRSGDSRRRRAEATSEANAEASASASAQANGRARRSTPSPSPSPSPSPVEAPPPTIGVDRTLSSSSARPDDEDTGTLDRTWGILAERHLDRRNAEMQARGQPTVTGAVRRRGWIDEDAKRTAKLLGRLARGYLEADPDLTPEALADLIDDPTSAPTSDRTTAVAI